MPVGRYFIFALFLCMGSPCLAQDMRTVVEPKLPPVCVSLGAEISATKGEIDDNAEKRLDTRRIQAAIDSCKPGTSVQLQGNVDGNAFLTGPLELKTGITLLVAQNTTLFGSRNPRDYDTSPGSCGVVDQNGRGCKPMISARKAPGAGVMGDGAIDGRGGATLIGQKATWWDLAHKAKVDNARQNVPRIIVTDQSDDFTLYRITLRNSPNFHVLVNRANGFTAWGVKIDSPKTARNTDGIDPSSSTNVSILYCYIRCGDDNVAIKAGTAGPATHMTIAHNHFYSGHGMSIGSETDGGASEIEVRDLTIDGADNGLRIKSNTTRGGLVHNVLYSNVCIRDVKNPILMDPFYSTERGPKPPDFRDIQLHNVFIATPGKITLLGLDAQHPLKVTMDGVHAAGVRAGDVRAAHAHIVVGAGGSNVKPSGEDVDISEIPGSKDRPVVCGGEFVPFPAAAAGHVGEAVPSSVVRNIQESTSTTVTVAPDGSGDNDPVQQAIESLPGSGALVRIRPGVYREVVGWKPSPRQLAGPLLRIEPK